MKPQIATTLPFWICSALVSPVLGQTATISLSLNPKSTFLRTDPSDNSVGPYVVPLGALGFLPGDNIRLKTTGDFLWNPGQPLQGTNAVAVFSNLATILPPSQPDRVEQKVACNAPRYPTAPTFVQNLTTDITEDFLVGGTGVDVVIPLGASGTPYLLVGADDVFWGDNTDPEGDFDLLIEALDRRFLLRVLCLDPSRTPACGTSTFSFPTSSQFASARAELLSNANFGIGGIVNREVELAVANSLDLVSLANIDVVLLTPVAGLLSTCELVALTDFVAQGGGVVAFENGMTDKLRLVTGSGPITACGGSGLSFTGSHPVLSGSFGNLIGGLSTVYNCRLSNLGPNGVALLSGGGGVNGAAFAVGQGRVVVINEEEWMMNSGGCPSAPSWSAGNPRRLFLNSIEWVAPAAGFVYSPSMSCLTAYCTAGTTTNGCLPAMTGVGTPSASATSGFDISIDNVEGAKSGIVFYGVSGPSNSPWSAGSSSFLCVKAPTQRMSAQNSGGTSGSCDGQLVEDWNAFMSANPAALGQPLMGGEVVWAQGWFRDPPAAKTTNLSSGLEFQVLP